MKNLTIQALINSQWLDIAELQIMQPEKGAASLSELEYNLDYAIKHLDKRDECACSLSLPIHLFAKHESKKWFGFLDDIVPSGAARRYWLSYLGLNHLSHAEQDIILLEKGTIAPVGNLRIKEALPLKNPESTLHLRQFTVTDVVNRQAEFLEYAQQGVTSENGI